MIRKAMMKIVESAPVRPNSNNACENDQADAIADTTRRDLFPKPHQEHRATDECDHAGEPEENPRIINRSTKLPAHGFKADRNAIGLKDRNRDRQVAGILIKLLPPRFAFLLQGFPSRDRRCHQLHNDAGADIGHDVQRKDGHAPKRAAREHVEHAKNAAAMLGKNLAHHRRINTRHRNISAKAIDDQSAKREPDTLLELGRLGKHAEIQIGHRLFHGGRHAHSPEFAERS